MICSAPIAQIPEDIVELHATAAGLKGLCTFLAAEGIEDLRKVRARACVRDTRGCVCGGTHRPRARRAG